ncbi:MAG: metal-dependent hydrolase [Dethiobacteria bacterium]|nr:metal-dependent hydrolase [Bacillota bacterium]
MPSITFLGHACFLIETGGKRLVTDPFLTDNPLAPCKPEEIKADYILVSHAHFDHLGDTEMIAKTNGATVISTAEIAEDCKNKGLNAHGMHLGGGYNFEFGRVKLVPAFHGSGIAGGHACGFVIESEGKNIYFAGDTGLFGDMQLIGELHPLDLALLPIGDNFTMGVNDAAKAASLLKAKKIIPYHYNTWPLIAVDPVDFKTKVEAETTSECFILNPGEKYSY